MFIYKKTNKAWNLTETIEPTDSEADLFGVDVKIYQKRIAILAYYNGYSNSILYIYDLKEESWKQSFSIHFPATYFGDSIGLIEDRFVSTFRNIESEETSVLVYDFDGVNWNYSTTLSFTDNVNPTSLSISGNRIVVQSESINSPYITMNVFDLINDQWTNTVELDMDDNWSDIVKPIVIDGNKIFTSTDFMAFIYSEIDGSWEKTTFIPENGSYGDNFGSSIQAQGGEILIGASKDDENGLNAGALYVYQIPIIDSIFLNGFENL